jgi:biopolymer transport protein ExbD
MKRLVAFMLLLILSVACLVPAYAQRTSVDQNARQSQAAAKNQQKAMRKAVKKQRKATKKAEKAQRKATKKANKELQRRRGQ